MIAINNHQVMYCISHLTIIINEEEYSLLYQIFSVALMVEFRSNDKIGFLVPIKQMKKCVFFFLSEQEYVHLYTRENDFSLLLIILFLNGTFCWTKTLPPGGVHYLSLGLPENLRRKRNPIGSLLLSTSHILSQFSITKI